MHIRIVFILLCLSGFSANGQQARFRDIVSQDEADLRFPVVILPDSRVAKKINDYLQINLLGETLSGASGNNMSSRIKHAWKKSGLDALDYTVPANNGRVLAFAFEGENIGGAHPNPLSEYYEFDMQTGEPILPDDLFTDEGMKELDKDLHRRRMGLIGEYLRDLREDTAQMHDYGLDREGLEELRSDLLSCDSAKPHGQYSITDTGIVFHTGYCLPHVMQSLDFDRKIHYGFSSLEPWLTDYGKEVLLGRKKGNRRTGDLRNVSRPMNGTIGTYPIVMQLEAEVAGPGKEIYGFYYYTSQGIKIGISGYFRQGTLTLTESDDNGNETGSFSGVYERGIYSGTWTNAKTKKTLPFTLKYALL